MKAYWKNVIENAIPAKMFAAKNNTEDPNVISGGFESNSLFLREFVFSFNLLKYILKNRKNIKCVYLINPILLCQFPLIIARLIGIKTIFDIRSAPINDNKLEGRILRFLDILHMLCASNVVTINLEMLKNKYGSFFSKKSTELPLGFISTMKPDLKKREKPYKFVFPTTIDKERKVAVVCKAFKGLEDFHLYLYGNGNDMEKVSSEFGNEPNIHIVGLVPFEELMHSMPGFDFGIAFIPKTDYYEYQPPLKTIEYLGAGLPVIATDTHGNMVYINETNGLLIKDTTEALREAIEKITTIAYDRQKIHDDAQQFRWDRILEKAFNNIETFSKT